MNIDLSAVIQLCQLGAIVGGGGLIWGKITTEMTVVKQQLATLATVPTDIARHDERLKVLEK